MERALGAVGGQLRSLAAVAGAALGIQAVIEAADAYTGLTNQLRVAGLAGDDLAKVQERLFAAAGRNGAQISAVTQLYSRGAMAAGDLGASQEKLLQFVHGVTRRSRFRAARPRRHRALSCSSPAALGGGIVRAEEFWRAWKAHSRRPGGGREGIDGMGGSVSSCAQPSPTER